MIRNTQDNEQKDQGRIDEPDNAMKDYTGIDKSGDNRKAEGDVTESSSEERTASPGDETLVDDKEVSVIELKKKFKENLEEVVRKNEEVDALKDILKRRQADFENYKKRMVKSQDEYRRQAIKDMSLDIISINDDLLRAIEASGSVREDGSCDESHRSFVEGVTIISRGIEEMLKKYGVMEIESLNQAFDPNHNEAVEIEESHEVENDIITKVYQKGFILDDLVIRPAKVRVTRPARKLQDDAGDDKDGSAEKIDDQSGIEGNSGDIGLN